MCVETLLSLHSWTKSNTKTWLKNCTRVEFEVEEVDVEVVVVVAEEEATASIASAVCIQQSVLYFLRSCMAKSSSLLPAAPVSATTQKRVGIY